MVKALQKHGNSHALVIDKPLMEAMGISPRTRLQVTLSGQSLVITPAGVGIGPEAVARSIRKLRRRYSPMLRRLAR
jgi:antitoxin component of MazEF toxin-antitoxin module